MLLQKQQPGLIGGRTVFCLKCPPLYTSVLEEIFYKKDWDCLLQTFFHICRQMYTDHDKIA